MWRKGALKNAAGLVALCGMVAMSAIITKEAHSRELTPLASVNLEKQAAAEVVKVLPVPTIEESAETESQPEVVETVIVPEPEVRSDLVDDTSIRYFNGRPVRAVRTIKMNVSAYSPDERSCAGTADGITSSNHDVYTNAMKLVAADSRVLPLGSLVSVPGYDGGQVVPVLDRGGAIKGNKLDVLYPTHEIARKWGRRNLSVTVWEYADGLPPTDYRKARDSRE